MKQLNHRRLLSLILALVMVVGMLPASTAQASDADMNEAYAARESLAPVGTAFTIEELLAWTPESDPDAAYSRASIALQDRQGGFVVNELANPEAKLMLCAMNDSPTAQGSDSFFSYAFNYWQYADTFIYWGGNGEGFIQAPTGELIDAAHTNGVAIVGLLGFPWGGGAGYVQQVSDFCQKAADGTFPVADKLIEVMDYYGFDGWFFNQESYGCNAEIAGRLNEMMRYMHKLRPDILISWYDSMITSGGVSYQDAVNDYNKGWMEADENGYWGVDEFFMNYNWTTSKINTTISTMKSIGRSQFDAFAGFNVQANVYGDRLRDYELVDEDGLAKVSLALFYSNQTQMLASDGEEFHKTEQAYYVNAAGDPRVNNVDVSDENVTEWAGMSRFFADKSPVNSAPFVTDFNTGHGKAWFVDGEKLRDSEWSYQSNQDVLPTFTWIIDSEGSKLEGSYDFDDAYNGGSSVKLAGDLTAAKANDILLYSTMVDVESGMKVNLTAKGGLENASLVAYLGDETTDSYEACEQVAFALTEGEGWVETSADLSDYAGKTLYGIGLKVESDADISGYQLNLGRLAILDKSRAALNGPNTVKLDDILYVDPYTAEARVQWSKVTGAASYEIYKVHADGSKTFLMETPNTAYYIPNLVRDEDETDVTIEVVPINRSGVRGKATSLTIDWLYGNDDGERYVAAESVNVCLGATVTGYSEQGDGAECDKALDGISGNSSKWWASGVGDWFSIDLGEEKTIVRLRMEHAEAGGEGKELNTSAYTVYYKDASGNWVEAYKLSGNTDAVNDVLLDTPVTAREWKLVINGIGPSPWSAVNIYEWQMFETGYPDTEPVAMHFASAFNGAGASDTFTLKGIPAECTVKVYNAAGEVIGETTGSGTVTIEGLDFGTADAGRVYYTTTESAYGESVKFAVPFEAENAEKSEPATDVEFAAFSQPGSVSASAGDDIYTTMTVGGLGEGDVVYVLGDWAITSVPVAAGETSVSIDRVRVTRAGGELTLQVKRTGQLISDPYTVETPVFDEPTATVQVYAVNESGETLTGVRFDLVDADGETAAQLSTTSDSGAKADVALGTYTIRNTESPEGYGLAEDASAIARIEGWTNTYTVVIPAEGEDPDPTDPDPTDPPVVDPSDDSRDIPIEVLTATAGDWQTGYEATEGPAELVLDNDPATLWHTDWYGTSRENHWIQFELSEDYNVDGLRYLPRSGNSANGTITEYDIQVSDDGETFYSVVSGNWENSTDWKYAEFPSAHVRYVRLVAVNAVTDNSYVFASAAEIRLTGEVYVDPMPPEMEPDDDSWDIPLSALEVSCGDYEPDGGSSEGPPELAVDENPATMWHTDWEGTSRENHWFQFEVTEDYTVCGLRYLPRQTGNSNGTITQYQILVSDDGENFTLVAEGDWAADSTWKISQFRGVKAKYVRLVSLDAVTDNSWVFASAAELRLTYLPTAVGNADKTELDALIAECELIEQGNYTAKSWQKFQKALEKAQSVSANPYASQDQVDEALAALAEAKDGLKEKVEGEGPQKILHLDSGRKYFSKDWHIALLNELAAAGYTHVQLAFGNNGFRFLLDDMTIEANGTTYASDDVKAGIKIGNDNYGALTGYSTGDAHALTEAEMDEIIAHGKSVGVEIIPHLNMPGHMSALLDAMEYVGIENPHFTGYVESDSSVDLNNEAALNFMSALVDKYAAYFAEKGVKYFHIGADEYANDAYNGSMGFPTMGSALYQKFADFVNGNAEIVKSYGMTPRAWNDGIYYGSYTSEFDSDIEINYWSSGWWGYTLAKSSTLDAKGHGLINTNGDYYYILGKDDRFTPGTSTQHDPSLYTECAGYDLNYFMDGSTIEEPVGGMFCVWADYPGAESEQEVAANIRLVLRAMALRMEGLDLDGMDTAVVEGGFNEDGTINASGSEAPAYQIIIGQMEGGTVTADVTEAREGDVVTLTVIPDEGYSLIAGSLKVNGEPIEGRTFVMPAEDVIITAAFTDSLEEAIAAAEEARAAAEAAQKAAEEAQRKAEEAAAAAEEAAASAAEDKEAAEAARKEAEEAQAAAEAAQKAAEDAQAAAETAQAAAEAHDAAAAAAAAEAAKSAQEVAELYEQIAAMKAEMAEYLKDAQKAAEEAEEHNKAAAAAELASRKYEALIELALYADPDDYDAVTAAEVQAAIDAGVEAINAAETAEEVAEALKNAKLAIDLIGVELPFTDVAANSFYEDAVKWALVKGITKGTSEGEFSPDKTVTRAEAVTFLWRAVGKPAATTENPFVDVSEDAFYYEAVLWAVENGITTGVDAAHFNPMGTANRAQIVTFLHRAAGSPVVEAENQFHDVAESTWYYMPILWAVENGITTGLMPGVFGPNGPCNRAQMVTFLYRAYA